MARVNDQRRFSFFIIENRILDDYGLKLGPHGIAVYCAIVRHANKDRKTWPSYTRITQKLGISRRSVAREIRKLRDLGLVKVDHNPGFRSVYTLLVPPSAEDATDTFNTPCQGGTATSFNAALPLFPDGMGEGRSWSLPPFPTGTTPPIAPLPDVQDPTTTTAVVAAVGGGEPPEMSAGASILARHGVATDMAEDLALTLPLPLLQVICEYWQAGAGGTRRVGTGLLVKMCKAPAKYGFYDRAGRWFAPAIAGKAATSASSAPPKVPTAEERRAAVKAERERIKKEREDLAQERARKKLETVGAGT